MKSNNKQELTDQCIKSDFIDKYRPKWGLWRLQSSDDPSFEKLS